MEQPQGKGASTKIVAVSIIAVFLLGIFAGYYIFPIAETIFSLEARSLENRISELEASLSSLQQQYDDLFDEISQIEEDLNNLSLSTIEISPTAADVLYKTAADSIVSIRVEKMEFGLISESQGSGFVFDEAGYIATNNHVVEGFEPRLGIEVTFNNGQTVPGEFIAADPYADIAVLKVELPLGVKPLKFGDSSQLEIGDPVVAIGNPFGLGGSITSGIVSQMHRTLNVEGGFVIPNVIQFDAAINPGNSGGPLLNYKGEVVGVTTAGLAKTVAEGIGFAIPSNIVVRVTQSLIENGEYKHPWMGIMGRSLTLKIAEAMKLDTTQGILIISVVEDGPADKAGLRGGTRTVTINNSQLKIGGDIIIKIDDVKVNRFEDLVAYTEENKSPGDTVELIIIRNGVEMSLNLTLGERPPIE